MVKHNAIQTGDLLVWSKSSRKKCFPFDYMKVVRLFTLSNYGHVSVAWVENSNVLHVEAVQPRIQKTVLPPSEGLYIIPMGLNLSGKDMSEFFSDKIGLPYGILDAFRAWAGWTLRDEEKWQCAELALEFYRAIGIDLPDALTPSELVRTIMRELDKPLLKLNR